MWPAISRSHCSDFPKVMDSNLTWWANLTPSALGNVSDLKTKRGKHDLILSREMEVPVRHLGDAVVLLFKETHSTSRLFFFNHCPSLSSCPTKLHRCHRFGPWDNKHKTVWRKMGKWRGLMALGFLCQGRDGIQWIHCCKKQSEFCWFNPLVAKYCATQSPIYSSLTNSWWISQGMTLFP